MSRYTKEIGKYSVAYGFDHYSGYFFQKFDEEAVEDEDMIVIDKSSVTGLSNGGMVELMQEYGVNSDHIFAVVCDLPF
jgi:uracil phosphoribosyltransferase